MVSTVWMGHQWFTIRWILQFPSVLSLALLKVVFPSCIYLFWLWIIRIYLWKNKICGHFFWLFVINWSFGVFLAEVTTPSGRIDLPKLIDNRNSTVTVRYEPTEIGTHQLDIFYNGVPVDGSPFQFAVDAVRAGSIAAYGGGLTQGIVGSKCSFVVDVADLGSS